MSTWCLTSENVWHDSPFDYYAPSHCHVGIHFFNVDACTFQNRNRIRLIALEWGAIRLQQEVYQTIFSRRRKCHYRLKLTSKQIVCMCIVTLTTPSTRHALSNGVKVHSFVRSSVVLLALPHMIFHCHLPLSCCYCIYYSVAHHHDGKFHTIVRRRRM